LRPENINKEKKERGKGRWGQVGKGEKGRGLVFKLS